MKYLQSINEYHRVVGFKYSEPREKYTVSLLCSGQDITKDKINIGLSKVGNLTYDENSIVVNLLDEETVANSPDGQVEVDAVVTFNLTVYTDREIYGVVDELGHKLIDIEILDYKSKESLVD